MICSTDEAKSLFRTWRDEKSELSCVLLGRSVGPAPSEWYVHGKCWVAEVSEMLVIAFGDESSLRISLSGILGLEFNTPLDLKSISLADSSRYGSWLSVYLSDGLCVLLGEREK
jgi:hypothetical protein